MANPPGPFPVPGSPPTGRSQPVSAKEQNLRADAFQTTVCKGRRNRNVQKGGESLKKDFIAE